MNRFPIVVFAAVAVSVVSAYGNSHFGDDDVERRKTVTRDMIGKAQEVGDGQSEGEAWVGGVSSEISPALLPNLNSPEEIAKRAAAVIRAAIPEMEAKMEQIGNVTAAVQKAFPEGSGGRSSAGAKYDGELDALREYVQNGTNSVADTTGDAIDKFVNQLPDYPTEQKSDEAEEGATMTDEALEREQNEADEKRRKAKEDGDEDWESAWKGGSEDNPTKTHLEAEADEMWAEQEEANRVREEYRLEHGDDSDWRHAYRNEETGSYFTELELAKYEREQRNSNTTADADDDSKALEAYLDKNGYFDKVDLNGYRDLGSYRDSGEDINDEFEKGSTSKSLEGFLKEKGYESRYREEYKVGK